MKKILIQKAGSATTIEPRQIGEILIESVNLSYSQRSDIFRMLTMPEEIEVADDAIYHRNTDLCVDIKTFLLKDNITSLGKPYGGILMRDEEQHYKFVEAPPSTAGKRNRHAFNGDYITITRRDDGSLRLNFKPLKAGKGLTINAYALAVSNEIRHALTALIGKESAE